MKQLLLISPLIHPFFAQGILGMGKENAVYETNAWVLNPSV